MDTTQTKNEIDKIKGMLSVGQQKIQPTPETPQQPVQQNNELAIPQGYDARAVNAARAIRKRESNGNYNAIGDNGMSAGAYQWNNPGGVLSPGQIPSNFARDAKEVGLDPNDFSPKNQDNVAYKIALNRIEAGYTVPEFAAEWNAGDRNAYQNFNQKHGNTPQYAQDVNNIYQELKAKTSGLTQNQPEQKQPEQEPTLGQELISRTNDLATGIKSIVGGKESTGQTRLSGLIQSVGAGAGAIGDITNKAIELIPGVKWIEKQIGTGIEYLANTEAGQSVLNSMQEFAQKHPELAKDLEAGVNIVSVIPILKGFSVAKNVALDVAASKLKNFAEKSFSDEITGIVNKTVSGRKYLQRNPDVIKTIVDERVLPDIEDGKMSFKNAYSKLSDQISDIEENELQVALSKADVPDTASRVPLAQYRQEAIASAENELLDTSGVEKYFDRIQKKYGDYPTLKQMNEAKRKVAKNIKEAGFNSPTATTDKVVRSTLQKSVEDGAKALGLEDVNAINAKMARLIKAQDALKFLQGKPVQQGLLGSTIKTGATAAGEGLGNMTGIPFAGALTGRNIGRFAEKQIGGGFTQGLLKRTGKGAAKTSLKKATQKGIGLVKGAIAQKAVKSKK